MHGAREHVFSSEQWVPRPIGEVFAFFSSEHNLEEITPPQLNFKVVGKSTADIEAGTLIEYRLKLYGFPFSWKTLIEKWEPGICFVDTQLRGPYKKWHHTHIFREQDGGTLMTDVVRYEIPFSWLTEFFVGARVRKEIEGIFSFRRKIIERQFGTN